MPGLLPAVRAGDPDAWMTPFNASTPASSATTPIPIRPGIPQRTGRVQRRRVVALRWRCRGGPGQSVRIDDLVVMRGHPGESERDVRGACDQSSRRMNDPFTGSENPHRMW